jgi:inosine-uridine nucleoside N-ribohydrolase
MSNNNQPDEQRREDFVASNIDNGSRNINDDSNNNTKHHLIFSTDCSGGLYGPNANYDECPAIVQSNNNIDTMNGPVDFRDVDDLMAITIALNNEDDAIVDAIIPIFGDASMRANFLTGTQLVHNIKGRTDIPIVPGASEASQPVFIDGFRIIGDINEVGWDGPLPTAQYQKPETSSSNSIGNIIDPVYLFEMSCINAGVTTILGKIEDAHNNNYQVDLMAIGPQTDIACTLLHLQQNDDKHLKAIRQIVALIGQEAGVPNGSSGATARDFNMISDPLAATIVLSFSDKIKIALMEFQLTIQTTTENPVLFNETTFTPDTLEFFKQAKATARPTEGPFDQYTVAYALHPEWFECDEYPTYVIQCNQNDGTLQTESTPPGIACTTGTGYSTSYVGGVSAELTIDIEKKYNGPLVIGNARGNILNYQDRPAAKATACTNFVNDEAFEEFKKFVYNLQ